MTVAQNIGFAMRLRRRPKAEIAERVGRVAELLELTPYLSRLPRELSGGQQQRVALGRAVIREPAVFLFDEPFSNLDAALRLRMRVEIRELHQRIGGTSIFVTHDQEEAMSISDRIAVMRLGRVEQFGTPEEIYLRPASRSVALFIGNPQLELIAGTVEQSAAGYAVRAGSAVIPLPQSYLPAIASLSSPEIEIGVRAEAVLLGEGAHTGTVRLVQPIGPSTYVTLDWDGGQLTARVSGIARFQPGESMRFAIDPTGLLIFDKITGLRLNA